MHTTQSVTQSLAIGSQRLARVALVAATAGAGSIAQAAVMQYQLQPGSSYERTRVDSTTQLPVASASVAIGGTIRIDTATGALVSAQFLLGNYSEFYDYAPLAPATDYAVIEHRDELQNIAAGNGVVSGTVIGFSGANGWTATASGSADCSAGAGTQGNAACTSAAIAGWSAFDIDLLFTPDFAAVFGSTGWTDSLAGTTDTHSLNLFAVRVAEVPVPGAIWLMGSGLAGLLAVQRRRVAG